MVEKGQDPGKEAWEQYARLMREFRMVQGLSQQGLSQRIPYSESAVGHAERLMRKPTEKFTREVERALGLQGELLELVPQIHSEMGPKWFREWPKVEKAAASIRTSEPMLIPGLLQTEAYARYVLLGEPGTTEEEAQKATRLRLKRQGVFGQPQPPRYSTLIDESVLSRSIGGPTVMREQLAHLLDMMKRLYITVRVVPLSAGLTTGLLGAFEVASMSDGTPDQAYVESAEAGQVTNRKETVRALMVRWDALSEMAHPANVSEEIIREVMGRYE